MFRLSYYPWLTQNVPAGEIDRQIRRFAVLVADQLERLKDPDPRMEVLPPVDVPEQISQLIENRAEVALMNPLGFVFARNRRRMVSAVAVALRIIDGKTGSVYFSQLYAHKKTGIHRLDQARGRSIGYGVSYSTSNFLIAAYLLHQAGVHPFLGFDRIEFLKGHEVVARAVYDGKVEIGAGHDGVIVDLSKQPGYSNAADVIVQIARSDAIPSDPVVVNVSDRASRQRLQEALVAAGNTPNGKEALKIFWGNTQGLAATEDSRYDGLSEALKSLKLDEVDLLPNRKS